MAKKVKAIVKINIEAGKANPAPPVGTALGPHGIQIMEFCNAYNAQTKDKAGQVIPVVITIYEDRSFDFVLKTPPVSEMIKKTLNLKRGAQTPHTEKVGVLTKDQLRQIAQDKLQDLNAYDVEAAEKIVAGTAYTMGVKVEGITA